MVASSRPEQFVQCGTRVLADAWRRFGAGCFVRRVLHVGELDRRARDAMRADFRVFNDWKHSPMLALRIFGDFMECSDQRAGNPCLSQNRQPFGGCAHAKYVGQQ